MKKRTKNLWKAYEALSAYEKAELWTSIINEAGALKRLAGNRDLEGTRASFDLIRKTMKKL
jgi:negative regulator of sigma E activity